MVPRHAIYDSRWVYVFEPDGGSDGTTGRLGQRTVPLLRSLGDSVLVDYRGRGDAQVCELAAGDRIIVSPLTKPVVGMKVRLRNEETSARADAVGRRMDSCTSNVVAVTTLGRGHGGR